MNYPVTDYNMYQNYGYYPFNSYRNGVSAPNVTFKGEQPDTVTLSTNNKTQDTKAGLSKNAKLGLGALAIVGIGAAAYILSRGKVGSKSAQELEKFAAEKLKITNLPEHIEFTEAKTLEEAMRYTREVLKIQNVDKEFSLEALNWVNKGLTMASNANKGKAKLPNGLKFVKEAEEVWERGIGHVPANIHADINSSTYGMMSVEKRFFDTNILDDLINGGLYDKEGKPLFEILDGKLESTRMHLNGNPCTLDKNLTKLVDKYYQNSRNLSIEDKRLIYFGMLKEQATKDIVLNGTKQKLLIFSPSEDLSTVLHEQGHLQDMSQNYINLLGKNNGVKIRYDRLDEFEKGFIDKTPELKTFFGDKEQNIVAKVSEYSKSGIGEFIAETYADLVQGHKFPEDVMKLYKKYNGPAVS